MIKDMTQGSPAKIILRFTIPLLLGNFFQQLYNIVDSIIVGNYVGDEALAAVGAAFPVIILLVSIAIGLTLGCSILISQYFGANQYTELRRAFYTCMIFMSLVAVFLSLVGLLISKPLLQLLQTPNQLMQEALLYLRIFFGGLFFMFIYNSTSALLRSIGDSKTPLYFLIFSTILNIILDLVFVLIFEWGVAGVAWATLIAQAISACLSVLYIIRKVPIFHLQKEDLVFDMSMYKKMLKLGIPSCLQQTIVSLSLLLIQGLVNSFNDTTIIAGFAACVKVDSLAIMPMVTISNSLSTFVAQNMGAGDIERVKKGHLVTLAMMICVSVSISACILLFGSDLIHLFVNEEAAPGVIDFGVNYLRVVSVFYVFFSIMSSANGVLRGAGDMNAFMTNTIINLGSRVLACYTLVHFIGVAGLWWGIPVSWVIGIFTANARYFSGAWKTKAVVQRELK